MKFDFTSIIDRFGKDAMAVDAPGKIEGFPPSLHSEELPLIPMWVADMNFATAPSIISAIEKRISHPLFGYYLTPDSYYDAIINWQKTRNGVLGLSRENVGYENGVLGGVSSTLNALCSRGDSVLLHSPTYIGFTHCLEDNGYKIVHSPLIQDSDGVWRMDYEDMEKKIVKHHIHTTIFCSPHNPTGRVWEKWELEKAFEIFKKHDVYVIADEIWSDLILNGNKHTPTQSINEDARNRTIALYSPSKTFNLAGLIGSYHIVYNKWLQDRLEKESSLSYYNSMNVLSMHALLGAYSDEGALWVDELREVLSKNVNDTCDYIRDNFEGITVFRSEGTYMLFLDCTAYCAVSNRSFDDVLKAGWNVGIAWQDGRDFHGSCHIRLNVALPNKVLWEALERMKEYVF